MTLEIFKRLSARRMRAQELSEAQQGYTGLRLYRHLEEVTGDKHPWIKRPIGVFYSVKTNSILIANQVTGDVTQLYKH